MNKKELHVRIDKITGPTSTTPGVTADLAEVMAISDAQEKMTILEKRYKRMLDSVLNLKKKSDVISKWKLADVIFSFLDDARRSKVKVESHLITLCRDTSISRTELKYLLRFRRMYELKEVDRQVTWHIYRSRLYDKIPYGKTS